ncbi:MAG TPA: response regulator transcription factor [Candidatus Eremiobacteraeota bacterium]|nr:MAG: Response regulator protein VraR [bacterium ADurb.Bin363]HPZ08413.1 response regulator transcription factor [Candidatus Eremiobacteraeota bacterium]
MSKKNWTDIFKTDLLALIKTDTGKEESTAEEKNRKVADMYFKGAWKEEGDAKWAFFEGKEEISSIEEESPEEELKIREVLPVAHTKTRILKPEDVVSITDIGRTLTSRYGGPPTSTGYSADEGKLKSTVWNEKEKIRVFFSEDNQSYQRVLSTIFNRSDKIQIVGSASNGMEAIEKIKSLDLPPHVILMDIAMPVLDGIQATRKILTLNPSLKILMLTAFGDKMNVLNAFRAGAIGYLRKDSGMNVILDAIKEVARGSAPPLQDDIASYLLEGTEEPLEGDGFSEDLQIVESTYVEKEKPAKINKSVAIVQKQLVKEKKEEEEEEIIEELELTEEEYIEEIAEEIIEEIIGSDTELNEDNLGELIKIDTTKKIAKKVISQFEEEEIPEGITREYLSEQVALKMVEEFTKKLKLKQRKKEDVPVLVKTSEVVKVSSIEEKIFYYKKLLREKPENIEEVINNYKSLKEANSNNKPVIDALAWAYMKKGLLSEALIELLNTLEPDIKERKGKLFSLFK